METKDLIKLENEYENKPYEWKQSEDGKKELEKIKQLEFQHVQEAKKIIDKLLLNEYLQAENKKKYAANLEYILAACSHEDYTVRIGGGLLQPYELFKKYLLMDSSFKDFYGFGKDDNLNITFFGDGRERRFEKDFFMIVDFFITNDYDKSDDPLYGGLRVEKYLESLDPNVVFADDKIQEKTIESTSSENSELEQQIAKIKKSHFTEEYKAQLIAELEQANSQRGDGKTSGRSI